LARLLPATLVAITTLLFGAGPAAAATDLGSLLADAPGFDWHEASGGDPNVIEGSFTAQSYGQFVGSQSGSAAATTKALEDYGFTGGYGKEWQKFPSHDLLVERVFEFSAAAGATSWFDDIKSGTESESTYQGSIAAASAVPDSFSAILKDPNFPKQWRVDFHKDNRVFVVHTDSNSGDESSLAVSQAQKEYSGNVTSQPQAPSWLRPVMYGIAAALLIFLVGLVLVVLLVGRHRGSAPAPVAASAGVQMSPDGAFWWDGARWRDANTEIPPNAQRSQDGAYWWDGRTWRRAAS